MLEPWGISENKLHAFILQIFILCLLRPGTHAERREYSGEPDTVPGFEELFQGGAPLFGGMQF